MSIPQKSDQTPITDRRQLVAYIESGSKPREAWRIGTEHEKFVFANDSLMPVPYDGPSGIRALLEAIKDRFGWNGAYEGETLIGLTRDDGSSISLEPGGQLELSGAPLVSVHQTCAELHEHLKETKVVCQDLGLGMLGTGFHPLVRREDVPWMPKGRYKIMREYMPKRGSLGLDMMTRTSTVQVNLDYADETDFIAKMRVGLALQPVATALFANSPFVEGRNTGFESFRSHVWTDVDPDRCGDLPFAFEPGFGFERWVDYVLDVPMYFVYRDGRYVDVSGQSFRDFIAGRLPGLPGETPIMSDWADHMTTVFPEVRAKKFIEMRGADSGPWERICGLPAFWVGLLYDNDALAQAVELIANWTEEERAGLRRDTPRNGLATPFRDGTLRDIARKALAISRQGLKRRSRLDYIGTNESPFLDNLVLIAETGRSQSIEMVERFEGPWGGDIRGIFGEYDY